MTLNNNNKTKKKYKKKIIIGILTSPIEKEHQHIALSYLYKSYIQWAKLANVRIIPLQFNLPKHILKILLKQINGVIMVGGSIPNLKIHDYDTYKQYIEISDYIINYAKKQNNLKNYYPIFLICLGFEILGILTQDKSVKKAGDKFINREGIDNIKNVGKSKLYFTDNKTKLRSIFSEKEIKLFEKNPCVYYNHNMSFNLDKPYMKDIKKEYVIVSADKKNNTHYPTAFEHKKYPFYATLFHPEKPLFINKKTMPKGKAVKILSTKLIIFFSSECKKNKNKWIGGSKETDFFIENYSLYKNKTLKRSMYIFGEKDKYYI